MYRSLAVFCSLLVSFLVTPTAGAALPEGVRKRVRICVEDGRIVQLDRQPQRQVGEGQVGEQLPVADELLERLT